MKTIKFLTTMMLTISFMITGGNLMAQKTIEKVLAEKQFKVVDNATLQIDHKYGKIVCKNHDLNTIYIKVTASLETKAQDKAEQIFERIDLSITGDELKVKVNCELSDKIVSKNDNLTVDIEIFLPQTINLEINQMFGNTYIENASGRVSVNNRYGSFQANEMVNSDNDIKVSFGNATIGAIEGGVTKISYGDLTIKKAGHIELAAEYSNTRVTEALSILAQNEGGSLKIGTIDICVLNSKFSDNEVGTLNQSIKAKSEYGSLKVENIAASFSSVDLTNSFGSSTLVFDNKAGFNLEAEMSFCDLKYPENKANLSEKVTTAFKSNYKGKLGSAVNPGASVFIKSSYGNVDIKFE
ncbi:MAG: hypothetical protein IH598_13830 [Bacteroidales bacterium]|nr:hypothetical protein [Bacteroidales bacterium]